MTNLSIERLSLANFRNYEQFDLEVSPDPVVITGDNGVGKTNILEAISLLVPGRGIRNAKIGTLERKASDQKDNPLAKMPWSIFANIRTADGEVSIGTGKNPNKDTDRRIVKINGETKRGQNELSRFFAVSYLTPQMDQTFSEGLTSKRSFLDRLTLNFYPDHSKHIAIYNHVRSERLRLLEYNKQDDTWLSSLEQKISEQAISITTARVETIARLQSAIDKRESSFPKAKLSLEGEIEGLIHSMTSVHAEEAFKQKLKESRQLDKETGKTNLGAHKSDFIAHHSIKNLPAELCSTGEQKALLISITLASVEARKEWFGSAPVILLDEVIAHLDKDKRAAFFEEIEALSAQSWLTGTEMSLFEHFKGKARFLTIENSAVLG